MLKVWGDWRGEGNDRGVMMVGLNDVDLEVLVVMED